MKTTVSQVDLASASRMIRPLLERNGLSLFGQVRLDVAGSNVSLAGGNENMQLTCRFAGETESDGMAMLPGAYLDRFAGTVGGRVALEAMERDYELRRSRARRERRRRYERLVAERAVEIDAFQRSLARTRTLAGAGYRIVLAKTQEELRAEGKRMCNCVGMGHYGEGIVLGDRLIVMLRHGNGRSYCDIEIDRRSWKVVQCYLRRNEAAPEEVRSLARRIAGTLRSACARMRRKTGARKRSAA